MVSEFLPEELPLVHMEKPEGTFLCWLDFTDLGMEDEELLRRVNQEAKGDLCARRMVWAGRRTSSAAEYPDARERLLSRR